MYAFSTQTIVTLVALSERDRRRRRRNSETSIVGSCTSSGGPSVSDACARLATSSEEETLTHNLLPSDRAANRFGLLDLTVDNPEASAHGAAAQAVSMEIEQEIGMLSARIRFAQEYSASKG
jgi:hypothetical protein